MSTIVPEAPAPYLITAAEAARLLACKPYAVLELIECGALTAGKIGRRWVLDPADVREYAETVLERGELTREDLQVAFHHGLDQGRREGAAGHPSRAGLTGS